MEYVDGGNLDDYISNNTPIDEPEAVRIVKSICDALVFMHDKKMLHLDLKPKNIMRSSKGEIYLIDSGLSKHYPFSAIFQRFSVKFKSLKYYIYDKD